MKNFERGCYSNEKNGFPYAIPQLQPDASVSDNTLSLSRGDVANSEEEVRQWAESLE